MKRYGWILIVLGCTACQHAVVSSRAPIRPTDPEWADLRWCSFWDTNYYFQCPRSEISSQPQWKLEEDYPPLPPRRAEAAAVAQARLVRPDVARWDTLRISLAGSDDWYWHYVVTLIAGDRYRTGGHSDRLEVPVLMNGRTVQAFTDENKK